METTVDYLIIGGGIAGVTAAETIRETDKTSTIAIIASEPHMLYSRVLLPSYIKQRIKREQVFMRKISDYDAANISFYAGEEAVEVRPTAHDVVLRSGAVMRYGKLLIATGGHVRQVPFQGVEGISGVFRLQTIDDADFLYQALPSIKEAVVLGGGFIALEFLEILRLRGISTTLVCKSERFAEGLMSEAGSGILETNFADHEIKVLLKESVAEVESENGKIVAVRTFDGKEIKCDALCVGIGIEKNISFLKDSGIATGEDSILADKFLTTNDLDIFAAGDVVEFDDVIFGVKQRVGNWNNAFLQGKAIGRTMRGDKTEFRNLSGYSISNLSFHLTFVGRISRELKSVVRYLPGKSQYAEFFFANGSMAGASLINLPKLQAQVQKWILGKYDFSGREAELADVKVSLDSST